MSTPEQPNSVRSQRTAKGWSQQDLADRTGLSRAGISAIESGRLAPSVNAAIAISRVLEASVEKLFSANSGGPAHLEWAVTPSVAHPRYWTARVGERTLAYPIGEDSPQLDWHDRVFHPGAPQEVDSEKAERTLVLAGCDPAAGLLAGEYTRQFHFRMIVLRRNSTDALSLLSEGKVHVAGLHLGRPEERTANRRAARLQLGKACELVRVATWEEGLAMRPGLKASTVEGVRRAKAQWVGREKGSGARQCQDEALDGRPAPKRVARDHRTVAAAIQCGWADVGPCVRLVSEEAGLSFLKMHEKNYDFCFHGGEATDPRISALVATLRSRRFRAKLAELPGYRTDHTGEIVS